MNWSQHNLNILFLHVFLFLLKSLVSKYNEKDRLDFVTKLSKELENLKTITYIKPEHLDPYNLDKRK